MVDNRNRGGALAVAVGDIFGIDNEYIVGMDASAEEATIYRAIRDSQNRPALLLNPDGTATTIAIAAETFDLRRPKERS